MINKAIIIGRLGSDPNTRFTQDGTCVCNMSVATTERFKNRNGEPQDRTEWHRVVLWGRLGEIANEYLTKGALVYIEGKIETRKWQDRDGNDRYTTEIRGHTLKMLGGGNRNEHTEAPASYSVPGKSDPRNGYDDAPMDDDIPF